MINLLAIIAAIGTFGVLIYFMSKGNAIATIAFILLVLGGVASSAIGKIMENQKQIKEYKDEDAN